MTEAATIPVSPHLPEVPMRTTFTRLRSDFVAETRGTDGGGFEIVIFRTPTAGRPEPGPLVFEQYPTLAEAVRGQADLARRAAGGALDQALLFYWVLEEARTRPLD